MKAQPHLIGKCNFSHGISHLSQLSGREHRDLQRHILPAILGHPQVVPQIQKAVHAFLDFSYKVQFPAHSNATLGLMEKDLSIFYKNYHAFITNGSREPTHMKIPKLHYLRHAISDIKYLGALDGVSTETMETLHRLVKAAYPLTNRRHFKPQIIRLLHHTESVHLYSHYLEWTIPSITSGIANRHGGGDNPDGGSDGHDNRDGDDDSDADDGNDLTMMLNCNPAATSAPLQQTQNLDGGPIHLRNHSLGDTVYQYSSCRTCNIHHIDEIIHMMPDLDVISPFIWFFVHGKHGASRRTQRQGHHRHELPGDLNQLYTWFSFKIEAPTPNGFYQCEMQTLHCNPGFENKPPVFDPVVIETWPEQTGLKSMPFDLHSLAATDICPMPEYQIARICFVFSPTSNVQPRSTILAVDNLYAFVLWFEPISSPLPHSRFRTVQKMKVGGQQATGVVHLTDIKFSCELAPVLGESFWDGTMDQGVNDSNSLDCFDTFYLNCFSGHLDYELLA
jgi:hypothetical protein